MNTDTNGAESLIEILNLCEQTLVAFNTLNGTNDPLPIPVKARVPAFRRQGQLGRCFTLIKGGLIQSDGGLKIA